MIKYLFITLGTVSLGLGILGIFTPGLPTTPFVLLTAYLYAKSSPRLHARLVNHRIMGRYVNRMNGGVDRKTKIISLLIMWSMICFTVFVVFSGDLVMQHVMLGLGIVGTIFQLIFLRKKKIIAETVAGKEKEEIESVM